MPAPHSALSWVKMTYFWGSKYRGGSYFCKSKTIVLVFTRYFEHFSRLKIYKYAVMDFFPCLTIFYLRCRYFSW